LDMAKIEAGRTTLQLETVDLGHLLQTVQDMLMVRAQAKQIYLKFDLEPTLPTAVEADPGKLRQVLVNLLGNAIKFTPTGGVTLTVSQNSAANDLIAHHDPDAPTPEDNNPTQKVSVTFTISDTGIGMDSEELKLLFQPFVQTNSSKKVSEGTGLGLVISRQFVQLMGGDIHVRSLKGQGSTFTFTIPFKVLVSPMQPLSAKQVSHLAPGQRSFKILVVDDKVENRDLLVQLLRPIGFDVITANDGEQAIGAWKTHQPDAILMDIKMPVMDGETATRQIKAEIREQHQAPTQVIALTASVFESERQALADAGCDDFMVKPFNNEYLLERLRLRLGCEYIYVEPQPVAAVAEIVVPKPNELTPESLQVMPLAWIQELERAAKKLNAKRVKELVAQIPPEHEGLRLSLEGLVQKLRFDQLLKLCAVPSSVG